MIAKYKQLLNKKILSMKIEGIFSNGINIISYLGVFLLDLQIYQIILLEI